MSGALALLRRRPQFRALLIAAAGGILVTLSIAPTMLRARPRVEADDLAEG